MGGENVDALQFFRFVVLGDLLLCGTLLAQDGSPTRSQLLTSASTGGNVTCENRTNIKPVVETLTIPHRLFDRAKKKARLASLLRESLYDDANGIVNAAREKEIKHLANDLRR